MNIFQSIGWHYKHYGIIGTIKKELWKRFCQNGPPIPKEDKPLTPLIDELEEVEDETEEKIEEIKEKAKSMQEIIDERFLPIQPIAGFTIPYADRRINLVTDSINSGSLFGGVATSLILVTLLAKKWDCDLRIITRTEEATKTNFIKILQANGIDFSRNVEFIHSFCTDPDEVPIGTNDFFLTTSWWSTWSVINLVDEKKVIYILQEDERTFYPYGDDYLRCKTIFQNPKINFVVNSKLLFDSLINDGFVNMQKNGLWFEPAFSNKSFYYQEHTQHNKFNFFFYARPNNVRNLFYFGLDVINQALLQEILNPKEWDFYFLGKDIPDILINEDTKPFIFQNIPWDEYAGLIRKMDLGLSLMYSPHPSYPPLDLAASGAVAVTNRFKNKKTLDMYSKNIICEDLNTDSMLKGIAKGVTLAKDLDHRLKNYKNNTINQNWETAFADVLNNLS